MSKYARTTNEDYLESAYAASSKLYDVVPLVTRPGVDVQIREAIATARKAGAPLRFEDHPYKLVSREFHPADTIVSMGGVPIGGPRVVVMAGPCAVESLEQTLAVAREVKRLGAALLRGGAFKPRTSPYSFQGLGEEGLKILAAAREETGLPVVTEVLDTAHVDLVARYADGLQIGARNMQNFELLKAAGRIGKPVLLKRGMSATLEEFLLAAEYVLAEGNPSVVLCERGVRTFRFHRRDECP